MYEDEFCWFEFGNGSPSEGGPCNGGPPEAAAAAVEEEL